jgi:hypothetical protein
MSKKYSNALLDEEVKEDNIKSKSKSSGWAARNEATFKDPANHTNQTKKTTNSGSNASSATKDQLKTSVTSASKPQHLNQSPCVDQRMNDLSIGGSWKKK